MADRQFGPYRLVRQIAVGGMAEIHLAKTKGIAGFEKYVALKMIHPNFAEDEQFIQMLVDEAKIAVQLNHGNIAQTFDLGRVGETFYITMEYVDGADLYKILRKGSEIDIEMPLDVCAFIGKEVASALDHAHRKKDHLGKALGIVHRDVSPQNVLISYSGEVKLVDFGIAKATMKARQTAVGVIKGKYYYMSPEQAWGDPLDHRSDIFSAGIVLYEMVTGQMLYLEEDLHKLLDMARRADIASPSTLRRGIPPQLERIMMHALAKAPGDRYQNAGDLASDLERFLHAYSPVFTAAKLSGLLRQIAGDPVSVPEYEVEVHEGANATHTLNTDDLIHDKDELHDENSVIFRVADLQPPKPEPRPPASRVTPKGAVPVVPARSKTPTKIPAIPLGPELSRPARITKQAAGAPQPVNVAPARAPSKPRLADEQTRQVEPIAPGPNDESGLLNPQGGRWDAAETHPGDELENINESTMITGAPSAMRAGFMMDIAGEDGVEATLVTSGPPMRPDDDDEDDGEDGETITAPKPRRDEDEEHPTIERDFRDAKPKVSGRRAPAPAALGGKIHAPAVSELRKPRASRKTPPGGVPQSNVLHAIVSAQPSEPMPAPRPNLNREDSGAETLPAQPPVPFAPQPMQQQPYNGYSMDASGLPLGIPTPPSGTPVQMVPGVPPHLQPYAMQPQNYPPPQYAEPYPPNYAQYPPQQQPYSPQGYPQMTPNALYQFHGGPQPPTPMSLTGQMRLFEADEMPSQYRVSGGPRWLKLVIAGVIAISVAASATFFIIRSMRETAPSSGSINVQSVPPGAEITYDGARLTQPTPYRIEAVPVGTRHEIRLELAHHQAYIDTVDVPKQGGEVPVTAVLKPITGRLVINTIPAGAEVLIDGQVRGRTSTTINDIDMASAKQLELRLKDYQPYIVTLVWPANGVISIDQKLTR